MASNRSISQNSTQNSTQGSSSSQQQSSLTASEVNRKACELVHLFLVWQQRNYPLRRVDILKYVVKEHKSSYSLILKDATEKLLKIFGFEVQEIGEASRKGYVLVNILENCEPRLDQSNRKRGLLTWILTLIFMSGGQILEEELWNRLKRIRVVKDLEHPYFGFPKKLISEFVRQQYLVQNKIPNTTPPQLEYRWGERTQHGVSKREILKSVSKVHQYDDIKMWQSQYNEVTREEGNGDDHDQS